jgi:alanine racemase
MNLPRQAARATPARRSSDAATRWAWAEVDLDAVAHNVGVVREVCAPAQVWAVVKADGYGHGAAEAAVAALAAGASGLCVALVSEGVALRRAGIDAPVLVLAEQPDDQLAAAVEHRLTSTVYSVAQIDALVAAGAHDHPVHLKVDTGMHRVGASAADAPRLAEAVRRAAPALRLEGVFTHLAVADEPGHEFTVEQLDRFDLIVAELDAGGHAPDLVHAANSAGALAHPRARRSLVRAGIALYGIAPSDEVAHLADLRPALSLHARVSHVKRLPRGARISYGLRHTVDEPTTIATIPIGYADGVPRRLHATGGEVLIGGRRRPIVGAVTMDQLMVDCGDDDVEVGDAVVLIGRQGDEEVTAAEWAHRLDTIAYEIVTGIGPRVERRYVRSGSGRPELDPHVPEHDGQ